MFWGLSRVFIVIIIFVVNLSIGEVWIVMLVFVVIEILAEKLYAPVGGIYFDSNPAKLRRSSS